MKRFLLAVFTLLTVSKWQAWRSIDDVRIGVRVKSRAFTENATRSPSTTRISGPTTRGSIVRIRPPVNTVHDVMRPLASVHGIASGQFGASTRDVRPWPGASCRRDGEGVQRLSGTDAGFLYGETPAWHMHAGAVVVLDPATTSAGFDVEAVRDLVRHRLPHLGLLRYRATAPPLGIGGSHWVEVPDVDLDAHVRTATLPAPGGMAELAAFSADVLSQQLDRRRPLWQMWLVSGLEHGRFALIIKVHHACVDGVRATQLYEALFDLTADVPLQRAAEPARTLAQPRVRSCSAARQGELRARRCAWVVRCAPSQSRELASAASRSQARAITSPCRSPRPAVRSTEH